MADFKILGGTDPATNPVGTMTQGIGYPLRQVDESTAGGTVTIQQEQLLRAADYSTQEPTATDTALQITFGAPQTTGIVDVDAAGVFTFQETDEYQLRLRLEFGRTTNPGVALLFGRMLVNGVPSGDSVFAQLDDAEIAVPTTFEGTVALNAGDQITVEIIRDSSGNNNGGVFAKSPTLAGWADAPSALFIVSRSVAVAT